MFWPHAYDQVHGEVTSFTQESYLNSLVRLDEKVILKPQNSVVVRGKCRNYPCNGSDTAVMSQISMGCIAQEPGWMIAKALAV